MLSYRSAVDLLMTLPDFERHSRASNPPDFHLRRVERLMDLCGRPHQAVPAVHIAGSKGKGSTAAMVASALAAHGYRAGLYTSPSLHTVRERIRVGLTPVSEAEFAGLVERMWPHVERVHADGDIGRVSFFEIMTAMAWAHFAEIGADFQVVEVGLGGRLDATNLLMPAVSVITPVGLDHVAVLGDTIEKIAAEKAGIIKDGVPVVVGRQLAEAMGVIEAVAAERGSTVRTALERVSAEQPGNGARWRVRLVGEIGAYEFAPPLAGRHQIDNARTTVAALEALSDAGHRIEPESVARGLAAVEWPARVQVLQGMNGSKPGLVVDGAHNAESAAALVETVEELFPERSGVVLIYGGSGGHEFAATAAVLNRLRPRVVVTRSRHPKAVDPRAVAKALVGDNVEVVEVTDSTEQALAAARRFAGAGDLIVGTGSLIVAAEIIEIEQGIPPEYYPTLKVGAKDSGAAGAAEQAKL